MAAQRNSDHYPNSPNISKQMLNSTILNRSVGGKSDDNRRSALGLSNALIRIFLAQLLYDQHLNSPNFSKCR